MQHEGDGQAQHDLDRNRDREQQGRAAHRLPEHRIGQDGRIVFQPHEALLGELGQVEIVQAFPDRIEQWGDAHDDQRRDGWAEEGGNGAPGHAG